MSSNTSNPPQDADIDMPDASNDNAGSNNRGTGRGRPIPNMPPTPPNGTAIADDDALDALINATTDWLWPGHPRRTPAPTNPIAPPRLIHNEAPISEHTFIYSPTSSQGDADDQEMGGAPVPDTRPNWSPDNSSLPDYESPTPSPNRSPRTQPTSPTPSFFFGSSDVSELSVVRESNEARMQSLQRERDAAILQLWDGTPQLTTRSHWRRLEDMVQGVLESAYLDGITFREAWALNIQEARVEEATEVYNEWVRQVELQELREEEEWIENGGWAAEVGRDVSLPGSPVSSEEDEEEGGVIIELMFH